MHLKYKKAKKFPLSINSGENNEEFDDFLLKNYILTKPVARNHAITKIS